MIDYLFKNLKGTDWELLTDFVSPVFFEVVPTLGMAKVFGSILKDYSSAKEFKNVKTAAAKTLEARVNTRTGKPLQLVDKLSAKTHIHNLSLEDRQEYGSMVLKIYFSQLFADQKTILDLRSSAFNGMMEWAPKPVFYGWSPEFKEGLQKLYSGFYQGNDLLFKAGLEKLNLSHAESVIHGHFGQGNQDAVTFSLDHFKQSLHAVFMSCKNNKTRLHPDFFGLGVYLLCLYENLEGLNCPLDVRLAFKGAVSQ
jgi:hypothetical protein